MLNIPVSMLEGSTSPMVFGLYEVEIDPEKLDGSINMVRSSDALGDNLQVDITPFLSVSPCNDCIKIKSISLNSDNLVEVGFQTKHPFKPDTRYDLHVFDMRGIIVSAENTKQFDRVKMDLDGDGSQESMCKGNVDMLVNADGYTSFYDAVVENYTGRIFDSNICPYKNLWMNPATTSPGSNYNPVSQPQYGFMDLESPKGHNVFPMGGTFDNPFATTIYKFDFSETGQTTFLFILEASYAQTSIKHQRKTPRYFLPEFHRKDAWYVGAELTNNELAATDSNSSATLRITVMDWQAGRTAASAWDYATSNLTDIRYKSDIKEIVVDIPGILNSAKYLSLPDLGSGNGSYTNPYIWNMDFLNEMSADEGYYWGLVAVRDDLQGSPNAPMGVSGDKMTPVKMSDITTYQSFKVYVEQANDPPVSDIDSSINQVKACADISFFPGPNCQDPENMIVSYEYDFDYDGVTFDVDASNTTGDPVVTSYDDTQLGVHTVALRVTDDFPQSDIDSITITVIANQPPVAVIMDDDPDNQVNPCNTVTFSPGAGTSDPDGSITLYEYDFSYDGSNFTADVSNTNGSAVSHSFTNSGSTDISAVVALRVTDDGCPDLTALSTVTFTVHPLSGILLFENFEETVAGTVPSGWGVVGRFGESYWENTLDQGCNDDFWHWGVTQNSTGLCETGTTGFLNESGAVNTTTDPLECYENRGTIVYTTEFTVPPAGATVTLRHNFNMTYVTYSGTQYHDGGRVILSVDNPGSITWTDFCNAIDNPGAGNYDNSPLRPLAQLTGPTFGTVSSWYSELLHPLRGQQAHVGSSGGWVTSTYVIPALYACETVRLGMLFASDDLPYGYLSGFESFGWSNQCTQYPPEPPYSYYVYPRWGWRINSVQITSPP
jgi:hypothetical protein